MKLATMLTMYFNFGMLAVVCIFGLCMVISSLKRNTAFAIMILAFSTWGIFLLYDLCVFTWQYN